MSGNITGQVDALVQNQLMGWAMDPATTESLRISVRSGDRVIGEGVADVERPDVGRAAGFIIDLAALPSAADIDGGRFRVEASRPGGGGAPLRFSDRLRTDILEHALTSHMAGLPMAMLTRALAAEMVRRRKEQPFARLARPVAPDELSPLLVPVGHVSTDGAVVVGREGQLFLLAGSNDLLAQYRDDRGDEAIDAVAAAWTRLFVDRAEALAARGIPYRQLILPEKSTILRDCFPVEISGPTRLFARLDAQLAASAVADRYLSLLGPLSDHPDRKWLYLGVDTHFSAEGIFFVLARLLSSLGLAVPPVRFGAPQVTIGDLGSRFPGAPLCSVFRAPELPELADYGSRIEEIEMAPSPRLDGTRIFTRNPAAPIDAKAMVFGNSYFGITPTWQFGSWWMSRLFREYHLRWGPEFDFDAIDAVRPDIVIGQTIERFLPRVPKR